MRKLLAIPVLAAVAFAGAAPAHAELTAGAANADITPPIGTPQFAYTARSRLAGGAPQDIPLQIIADPDGGLYAKTFAASRGIHTRVRARAIVLDTGGERAALVQVDLGGIPYALVQRVYELIPETGIPLENIMIAATHTHSSTGPIWPIDSTGYAALGGDVFDPRVFEFTAQGIARAIVARQLGPRARRSSGIGKTQLTNASRNRNFEPFKRNEDVPKDEAAREGGVDRSGDDRPSRGRGRRPADRRLVELRRPPDLLRRREPPVLGRQRRVHRADRRTEDPRGGARGAGRRRGGRRRS